jgi:hypothetical protein
LSVRAVFDLSGCCSLFRSVNDFKQAGCAHAAANAHRDNAILRPAPPASIRMWPASRAPVLPENHIRS